MGKEKSISGSEKQITIKDIARIAKLSTATVSMVINEKLGVSEETRYRVLRIARALNYTPNLVARSLVKRHSHSIAMLITNTQNPVFPAIAGGVVKVLEKFGYSMSINSTYDDKKLEAKEIETIKARGIDGLIISCARLDSESLIALVKSGFPVVSVLRRVWDCDELDYVNVDNIKGGYLAAEHLIRLGHKRIGIIKGPSNTSTGVERFEGALKALKDYGVAVSGDLIYDGDYLKESGYLAANRFLTMDSKKRPTAIYACNDDMAIGAFEAAWDHGFKIPENVALVGFNNVETTSLRSIEITSISQFMDKMGQLAANRLINKIEKRRGYKKPYRIILEPKLIIRKSCGYSITSKYAIVKGNRV